MNKQTADYLTGILCMLVLLLVIAPHFHTHAHADGPENPLTHPSKETDPWFHPDCQFCRQLSLGKIYYPLTSILDFFPPQSLTRHFSITSKPLLSFQRISLPLRRGPPIHS